MPGEVGFYIYDDNDDIYYYSLEDGETNTSTDASIGSVGVQFGTSPSYNGGFPITIRMKALMVCY